MNENDYHGAFLLCLAMWHWNPPVITSLCWQKEELAKGWFGCTFFFFAFLYCNVMLLLTWMSCASHLPPPPPPLPVGFEFLLLSTHGLCVLVIFCGLCIFITLYQDYLLYNFSQPFFKKKVLWQSSLFLSKVQLCQCETISDPTKHLDMKALQVRFQWPFRSCLGFFLF